MLKRTRRLFLMMYVVSMVALAFQAPAEAMGSFSSKKNASSDAKSKVRRIEGKVAGCDQRNLTIDIITAEGKLLTVILDKSTPISREGKSLKIADVQWNDSVAVGYETVKGKNMAKSVSIEKKSTMPPIKKNR